MATVPSIEQDEPAVSVFQSDLPIDEKLDRARTELLDLSARNRLLNMPLAAKGAKAVEVVDEVSSEIFRRLVGETLPFSFLAGKAAPAGEQVSEDVSAEESDHHRCSIASLATTTSSKPATNAGASSSAAITAFHGPEQMKTLFFEAAITPHRSNCRNDRQSSGTRRQ